MYLYHFILVNDFDLQQPKCYMYVPMVKIHKQELVPMERQTQTGSEPKETCLSSRWLETASSTCIHVLLLERRAQLDCFLFVYNVTLSLSFPLVVLIHW